MILDDGYAWNGCVYRSLSQVAKAVTGTSWNNSGRLVRRVAVCEQNSDRSPAFCA